MIGEIMGHDLWSLSSTMPSLLWTIWINIVWCGHGTLCHEHRLTWRCLIFFGNLQWIQMNWLLHYKHWALMMPYILWTFRMNIVQRNKTRFFFSNFIIILTNITLNNLVLWTLPRCIFQCIDKYSTFVHQTFNLPL